MADYFEIQAALSYVDSTDREVWINVGNAIKSEFGANGLDLWLDWSSLAPNFNKKSAMATWKSLKRQIVPIGYVLKLAKQNGYKPAQPAKRLSDKERKARREKLEKDIAAAEIERISIASKVAMKSRAIWDHASTFGVSRYLIKKRIHPVNVRFLSDGSIIIPMMRYDLPKDESFVGIQTIRPDGKKLFPSGVAKSGSACRLGEPNERVMAVCEGYSTGCSLKVGFRNLIPVYVAFDSGNLMKVAEILRKKYKHAHLIICADNDQKTKGNPGIKSAKKVIRAIDNASIIYPIFLSNDQVSSDFNDLMVTRGVSELERQLSLPLRAFVPLESIV